MIQLIQLHVLINIWSRRNVGALVGMVFKVILIRELMKRYVENVNLL